MTFQFDETNSPIRIASVRIFSRKIEERCVLVVLQKQTQSEQLKRSLLWGSPIHRERSSLAIADIHPVAFSECSLVLSEILSQEA